MPGALSAGPSTKSMRCVQTLNPKPLVMNSGVCTHDKEVHSLLAGGLVLRV